MPITKKDTYMNIKINYGTGVATLPTAALDSIDRATKADMKLLFLLCAEPLLLSGENRETCVSRICERAGYSAAQVEAALAFWRGTGVLDIVEEDSTDAVLPVADSPTVAENPPADRRPVHNPSTEVTAPTVTVTRAKTRMLDEIPDYTSEELEQFLTAHKEASGNLAECQAIWGDMFNTREISVIISLVHTWGLSWDYVFSLLAYAKKQLAERGNQGKSLNYVYRMAMNYYKEGVMTEEALQQKFVEQERMNDFEHRIRSIFGLGQRNLTPKEKKFFSTWLYEYKYNIEIVELAYNITVDTKGSPNINYTGGILKNWYEDGLKTLDEIIAKREQENSTVRGIKEGSITPDNARETVSGILSSEQRNTEAPRVTNIAQDINVIRRLLDLGNRMLTEGETAAFTKWRVEYGYRYEIIYHAYQITLENCREYKLAYMDAILTKWHAQKLTTIEAVKAYEKGFKEDKQRKRSAATPPNAPRGDGSFETEDFFTAAVKRSFGEDFDPSVLN